ncbi:hypothetical protein JX580_00135 [Thiomicrospira microaerophila]|uniref:hypothetical protein n=1 Tax=Thiomicrospira microaerophila TaxID=406020 RepID=UPI00200BD863|nr:hypothetical protein [Thiomicrospira microaerophila]UQB42362.1 hypothetical protein JX580_00135 [Thiomicrospira microaerophila]
MMEAIEKLTDKLQDVKSFDNNIKRAAAEGKDFPSRQIADQAFSIIKTAETLQQGVFSAWATSQEITF